MARVKIFRRIDVCPCIELIIDIPDTLDEPRKCMERHSLMNLVNFYPFATWPFRPCLILEGNFACQYCVCALTSVVGSGNMETISWDSELRFMA
jgi:hypothetical protein